tara:strand:- start:7743 stop:7919 length:177 start_codon:yes stop_codon:yes gene_type:complete
MLEALKGKKTIATAIVAIAGTVAAYFNGDITDYQGIVAIFGALMAIFLRDGIKTEAAK